MLKKKEKGRNQKTTRELFLYFSDRQNRVHITLSDRSKGTCYRKSANKLYRYIYILKRDKKAKLKTVLVKENSNENIKKGEI